MEGQQHWARLPTVEEQARVASELYSALLRGQCLDARLLQLSAEYPEAAALAFQFAERTRHELCLPNAPPPTLVMPTVTSHSEQPVTENRRLLPQRRVTVLQQVDAFSCMRMCGWLGVVLAMTKMAFTGFLAIVSATFGEAYPLVVEVATKLAGTERLYQVLEQLLKWHWSSNATEMTPAMEIGSLSSEMSMLVRFPITVGLIFAIFGAVIAIFVNLALSASGGLRLHYEQRDN